MDKSMTLKKFQDQIKKIINPTNNEATSNSSKESAISNVSSSGSSHNNQNSTTSALSLLQLEEKYVEFKGVMLDVNQIIHKL